MQETKTAMKLQAREKVAVELQNCLVELIDMSLIGKQAHWNLFGPNFRSLHLQLDEMIDEYRLHSDTIAERCVALGVAPDGESGTVAKASRLPEFPRGRISDRQVVELFADRLGEVTRRFRERMPHVGENDLVSQDILIKVVADLEKQLWMIQAQLP